MSERRIDIGGRDVTDLPGLWSEDDEFIPAKPEPIRHLRPSENIGDIKEEGEVSE